jgi:hypothetical protein
MAQNAGQIRRSPRFIRVYLVTWGLLAVGALIYLATLAWQPSSLVKPSLRPQIADNEPNQAVRAMSKALADVSAVRRSMVDLQKDVGDLKDAAEARDAHDKKVDIRLSALEERVSTMDAAIAAGPAAPKAKPADKIVVPKVIPAPPPAAAPPRTALDPRTPNSIITTVPPPAPPAKVEAPKAHAAPLETGSIQQPISFGTPVVTPSGPDTFAVQLGANPSLPALRAGWEKLVAQHTTLASLQPRFIAPRAEGGPYRLLAGPFASKADADRACSDMQMTRNFCFSTAFAGQPL